MNELRIFGPPGTGKSTRLATEEIPNAVNKFGDDKVVVTSFTRTGAKEIATKRSAITGERIHVNRDHVGTLHALCFRLLGQPELVGVHVDQWNESYPDYELSSSSLKKLDESVMENGSNGNGGDDLLNSLNICRAKMLDRRYWPGKVKKFEKHWTDFKKQTRTMDFTDLIETCVDEFPYAPGRPDVIFVDEAQDFTRLQLHLVRRWGEESQWVVLVGDDDQTIYGFAGATPNAFLNPPVDERFKRILDQSFRVPTSVLRMSQKMIRQVSVREEKVYSPRKSNGEYVEGVLREIDEGYNQPEKAINNAVRQIKNGKTVMFLTTCKYMIEPIKRELKKKGLPFWNPYRKDLGDWNPLRGGKDTNTSRDMIVNFLSSGLDENYWDIEQFVSWVQHLRVKEGGLVYKNGKLGIKALKKAVKNGEEGLHTSRNVLEQILTPEAVHNALSRNVDWLITNTLTARQKGLEYPIRVYKKLGQPAIESKPQIIIGTIHSVKGGEADVVYLYPDISYRTMCELNNSNTRVQAKDELYRLFYVGMTRAREELVFMKYSRQKGKLYYVDLYAGG